MTRWLPIVGLGVILALAALVAVRPAPAPTGAERAEALAAQLRCPDCQGLSVADSPTRSAQEIRRQVVELVESGATDEQVRRHFVARYGEWVLLAPSSPAAWLVPFAVLAAGIGVLVAWVRKGARTATPPGPTLADGERRRVHDEAEALDA